VGIFPDRATIICLVGVVLMEQNDEWTKACRHMGLWPTFKRRLLARNV